MQTSSSTWDFWIQHFLHWLRRTSSNPDRGRRARKCNWTHTRPCKLAINTFADVGSVTSDSEIPLPGRLRLRFRPILINRLLLSGVTLVILILILDRQMIANEIGRAS